MRLALLLGACLLLQACSSTALDPTYRASELVFDEGLVGRWKVDTEATAGFIEFKEKRRSIGRDGFVDTFWPDIGAGPVVWRDGPEDATVRPPSEPGPTARIYDVVLGPVGKDGGVISLNGYLTEIDGRRYLGVQVSFARLLESPVPYPFVVPTHMFWQLSRDGDALSIDWPSNPVLVLPGVAPDARWKIGPGRRPDGSESGGLVVLSSVEDLREYYRFHAGEEKFLLPFGRYVRQP